MSSIAPALALLTAALRGAELRWQVSTPATPRKCAERSAAPKFCCRGGRRRRSRWEARSVAAPRERAGQGRGKQGKQGCSEHERRAAAHTTLPPRTHRIHHFVEAQPHGQAAALCSLGAGGRVRQRRQRLKLEGGAVEHDALRLRREGRRHERWWWDSSGDVCGSERERASCLQLHDDHTAQSKRSAACAARTARTAHAPGAAGCPPPC